MVDDDREIAMNESFQIDHDVWGHEFEELVTMLEDSLEVFAGMASLSERTTTK